MNSSSSKISFDWKFVSDQKSISNRDRRDVPTILAVDALFTIEINNEIYFQAELAILEFYKSLYRWKEGMTKDEIPEFHYYTIEYDDYEAGAILSMIPFSDKARVKTIWAEIDIYNVFELNYIVKEFLALEATLRKDIEEYYEINIDRFIKHIPFTIRENEDELRG
ncbi:hypothetical protein [Bacillus suaedae]|uniref:DUF7878 domain-containing protein n=1 Tax=Halalkalibacter suaedae TaxID=2822140 RepID=A0A940WR38_9BACI|nr:hypothetical protein [Bacillus suaedae]MBP3950258.1 hypothetical protein [Bacillus suaedae]